MKNLVTGGAGFIGSHLADYYLKNGCKVTVIDDLSTGSLENISFCLKHPEFVFHSNDVLEFDKLDALIKTSYIIFNLAAVVGVKNVIHHPLNTLKINIDIVVQLLKSIESLDQKPLLFIASSSEVYGDRLRPLKETDRLLFETPNKNHSSYPISKLCNESYAISYYKEKQVPVIIGRLFNTVGPRQSGRYGMVLPRFIKQALANQPVTVYGDGLQTRSFSHVSTICFLLDKLTKNKNSIGQIVNIGSEQEISILQLAKSVKRLSQSSSKIVYQSYQAVYGDEYNIIRRRVPDLTKLKKMTDITHQKNIDDIILDMIDDIKKT